MGRPDASALDTGRAAVGGPEAAGDSGEGLARRNEARDPQVGGDRRYSRRRSTSETIATVGDLRREGAKGRGLQRRQTQARGGRRVGRLPAVVPPPSPRPCGWVS